MLRASPNTDASHFSSSWRRVASVSRMIGLNNEYAERNRRSATRVW
jgi:hypothetical protein